MSVTRGLFFVFVGPGGTGKNTLMSIIMERHSNIKQLATATTRAMRPNEQHGRERIFVSLKRFREMIAQDELLEYQEVTPGKFYGIPRASVEDVLNDGQHPDLHATTRSGNHGPACLLPCCQNCTAPPNPEIPTPPVCPNAL